MPEGFKSLAEIFATEPGLDKIRNSVRKFDIVEEFGKIFPELVKIAQPVKMDKNVLHLRVENSVWRSELKFNENIIIEKVNKHFNEERIKGIKFVP